ncbi:swt1 RNA endoribonuclease [Arctopsyche grandis]|uniref:swt1 RNA endoribonuclease n=1 Tax=Arctopsyche grandis TaxID=121162 RepID=UPI00406D8C8E
MLCMECQCQVTDGPYVIFTKFAVKYLHIFPIKVRHKLLYMDIQASRKRGRKRKRQSGDSESNSKDIPLVQSTSYKAKTQIETAKKKPDKNIPIPKKNDKFSIKNQESNKCAKTAQKSNSSPATTPSTPVLNVHQKKVIEKRLEKLKNRINSKQVLEKIQSNAKIHKHNIAEKRLKFLKKRLSSEIQQDVKKIPVPVVENNESKIKRHKVDDETLSKVQNMECESIVEVLPWVSTHADKNQNTTLESIVTHHPSYTESDCSADSIIVVIDTNVMLSHIEVIDKLLNISDQSYCVMIPWRVFCELDNLKSCKRRNLDSGPEVNHLARRALSYLHENLPKNDKLIGQSLKEASNHIFPCETADDEILNCCLQKAQSNDDMILLTDDKNLCIKAEVNKIKALTHNQLKLLLDKKSEKKKVMNDLVKATEYQKDSAPPKILNTATSENPLTDHTNIGNILEKILSPFLEEEMKLCYNNLWETIVYKKQPWSLQDVLECIVKHWIAVFSEFFPTGSLDLFKELQYYFPRRRKIENLTSSDIKIIVSSSTKLIQCLKRNTLKSYFKLASDCCRSLNEIINNNIDSKKREVITDSKSRNNDGSNSDNSKMKLPQHSFLDSSKKEINQFSDTEDQISDMFQFIWNGFTNFCSQLGNSLGVTHCLDDKVTINSLEQLIPQADSVANQVNLLMKSISRILLCNRVSETSPEYMKYEANQAIDSFYSALSDTVVGMGCTKWNFDQIQLFTFCSKHRTVLEDGFNKFTMLHNLILECSVKYTSVQMQ